ncbi:MAG TPA: CHRD domain-containing protein [Jiangellaceae bacterium]
MDRRWRRVLTVSVAAAVIVGGTVAVASGDDGRVRRSTVSERLSGYEEDPLVLSTTGTGTFRARIDSSSQEITYRLTYSALEGNVLQAHIHLGGRHQSGGISVFLCTNLGNGPAGTQLCPAAPATVTGTISPVDVIGPAGQGITAQQFDELVSAIRAGVTYVNVHSSVYPGGEIRAQLGDHSH